MGGALLQLVAFGQQDTYLSGNPQITFWKVVYKRHTNFAIESIKQNNTGNYPSYSYSISRSGDMIHKCYLRVTVPQLGTQSHNWPYNLDQNDGGDYDGDEFLAYKNKFGHALIESMSLKIGGVTVDTQNGEFLEIWKELTMTTEKERGYNMMTGIDESELAVSDNWKKRTFYIPLQFFFCQHPGLSLPLIALQYHDVQIDFQFKEFKEMLCCEGSGNIDDKLTRPRFKPANGEHFNIELFVDYVYLDVDERRRMAQSSHEMLITQTKKISHVITRGVNHAAIDLKNLNHPVKELIWVAKRNTNDKDDFDFGNDESENGEIMKTASLSLNGTQRIEERDNLFFRCIQPYQHHTRIPMNYIYVYSFALKPEEIQPSGSCNFSRLDNAYLNVTHSAPGNDGDVDNYEYVIYALNWNVLRIQGGQGGIAFTN